MKFTFQPETKPLAGYTIKRAVDRGGFGEVYYALSDGGKEVALKLLQHNLEVELRGVSQCLNLKHPNLVTIFDVRSDADGDHWVVMEYVAGPTLEKALAEHPQGLPMEQVQRWLQGASQGLSFLHDRGLVHRDVKPGNLFLDQGVVKVGDVGLSKFITPSRRSCHTESVGTVYYMAPEVAHGRYGPEVDVYSLGVILYEMLTGRVPFEGESTGEILMKHLSQSPDLGLLPERLRPVLARALAKDPARRIPTVERLAQEFHDAVRGVAPSPSSESRPFASTGPGGGSRTHYEPSPSFDKPRQQPLSPEGQSRLPFGKRLQNWQDRNPKATLILAALILAFALHRPGMGFRTVGSLLVCLLLVAMSYKLAKFSVASVRELFFPDTPVQPVAPRRSVQELFDEVANGRVAARPALAATMPLAAERAAAVRLQTAPVPPPQVRVSHPRPRPRRVSSLSPRTVRPVAWRQRVADLSRSMSWAASFSLLFSALAGYLTTLFGDVTQQVDWGRAGLFTGTTLLASWGILLVSKLGEGRPLPAHLRRLSLLAAGLAVGSGAYWLHQTLMVELDPALSGNSLFTHVGRQPLAAADGQPTWLGYGLFFGALLGLRGWWRQADAFRSKRFRVGSLLTSVLVALLLPSFGTFPLGWAVTWAAAISCVVQLTAVWIAPVEREAYLEVHSHAA